MFTKQSEQADAEIVRKFFGKHPSEQDRPEIEKWLRRLKLLHDATPELAENVLRRPDQSSKAEVEQYNTVAQIVGDAIDAAQRLGFQ